MYPYSRLGVILNYCRLVCTVICYFTGNVTISGDITLTIDSESQFTLTCISTGGPATTVTWTRDSITVTEGTETELDDPETAQYTHTLTVTGSLIGIYTCTVANNKPSNDSAHFTVQGKHPDLMNRPTCTCIYCMSYSCLSSH